MDSLPSPASLQKLRVVDLKEKLTDLGLSTSGLKADLVKRLKAHYAAVAKEQEAAARGDVEKEDGSDGMEETQEKTVPSPAEEQKLEPSPMKVTPDDVPVAPLPTAPVESAPADPVPTPADPVPTPADPVPTPVDPVPTPVDPVPTPADPVPTPVDPVPTPADPVPTPPDPFPTPPDIVLTPVEPVKPAPVEPAPLTPDQPGAPVPAPVEEATDQSQPMEEEDASLRMKAEIQKKMLEEEEMKKDQVKEALGLQQQMMLAQQELEDKAQQQQLIQAEKDQKRLMAEQQQRLKEVELLQQQQMAILEQQREEAQVTLPPFQAHQIQGSAPSAGAIPQFIQATPTPVQPVTITTGLTAPGIITQPLQQPQTVQIIATPPQSVPPPTQQIQMVQPPQIIQGAQPPQPIISTPLVTMPTEPPKPVQAPDPIPISMSSGPPPLQFTPTPPPQQAVPIMPVPPVAAPPITMMNTAPPLMSLTVEPPAPPPNVPNFMDNREHSVHERGDRPPMGDRPQGPGDRQSDRPPMMGDRHFMPDHQQMMGDRPPMMGDRPPMMGDRPPMMGDRPHRMGDRPHMMDDRPPMMGDRPPMMGDRPPMMGDRQPMMGDRPPMMGDRPPMMGDRPPMMGDRPPMMGDRPPMMGDRPPMMGSRPPMMGDRPPMMGDRPPMMGDRPPMMGDRPPMMGPRPPMMADRPPDRPPLMGDRSQNIESSKPGMTEGTPGVDRPQGKEIRLPQALEKVLAFKDERALQVGVSPEDAMEESVSFPDEEEEDEEQDTAVTEEEPTKVPPSQKESKNKRRKKKKKKARKNRFENQGQVTTRMEGEEEEDKVEVVYVQEQLDLEPTDPNYYTFAKIFETFKLTEPEKLPVRGSAESKVGDKTVEVPKSRNIELGMEDDDDDDDMPPIEEDKPKMSKKKLKKLTRLSVAELKQLVTRPDVVEMHDVTAQDPRLLVHLKATRNTVPVPRHWCFKRKYLQGKRGIEKAPFELPEYIQATGITEMRQALQDKEDAKTMKAKMREKVRPKLGKIDIDYQKLHDAFFKWQVKPKMTIHGDLYYEGKEFETKLKEKKPGNLSDDLKTALGMPIGSSSVPPPWLIAMQRYGPPPSYPNLKIPGLNAPIPESCSFGYHAGGWGKPPVDETGKPLYGDVFGTHGTDLQTPAEEEDVDRTQWGELESESEEEEESSEEEESDEEADQATGLITPAGEGLVTPSGMTSIPVGVETPDMIELRKRRIEDAMDQGVETPALYQVLPEKKTNVGGAMMGSAHIYDMGAAPPRRFGEKAPGEGIEVALNPDELDMDTAAMQAKYDQTVREQQSQLEKEDLTDMVAEHAAKQKKRKKQSQDTSRSAKKYKEFKF